MARQAPIQYVSFYSAGSAAQKIDLQPVKKQKVTLPKPRRAKKQVVFVDPVAIIGIAMAVVMLVVMVVGVVQLGMAKSQEQALSRYVSALQEENSKLSDTYYAGFDLEEIRQIALAKGMIPVEQAHVMYVAVPQVPQEEAHTSFWAYLANLFA